MINKMPRAAWLSCVSQRTQTVTIDGTTKGLVITKTMASQQFFRTMWNRAGPKAFAACTAVTLASVAVAHEPTTVEVSNFKLFPSFLSRASVAQCEDPASEHTGPVALSPKQFRSFPLQKVEYITHNTALYRFALPTVEHESGLTVASCLLAKASMDGKDVVRPYTPVSLNNQKGYLDLIVKTYPAPGGLMSRHIQSLKLGDSLLMKGPFQKIKYEANMKKDIGMVAGGTGITPMLQVIREILGNPYDRTEVSLLFANVSEQDILCRDELEALQYLYPNFKVHYTLDKPSKGWKHGAGFVSREMLTKYLPTPSEDSMVLVCGPKGMMAHISGLKGPKNSQGKVGGLLAELGYNEDMVYKF